MPTIAKIPANVHFKEMIIKITTTTTTTIITTINNNLNSLIGKIHKLTNNKVNYANLFIYSKICIICTTANLVIY